MSSAQEVERHPLRECERELEASPEFDRFRCQPTLWMCSCGRAWAHYCDEAEGCFWGLMEGNDAS